MKTRYLVLLLMLLAIPLGLLLAQGNSRYLIPIWSGNHYIWLQLGDGLVINGSLIDVKPAPPAPTMTLGVKPVWEASTGGYRLPATPIQVAVYVNGIRYAEGTDYALKGDLIVPVAANWPNPADTVVLVDYR